ncbi:MAG: hypothetical protein ACW99U_18805 [Candidatus Thorarchaeota archaeon]
MKTTISTLIILLCILPYFPIFDIDADVSESKYFESAQMRNEDIWDIGVTVRYQVDDELEVSQYMSDFSLQISSNSFEVAVIGARDQFHQGLLIDDHREIKVDGVVVSNLWSDFYTVEADAGITIAINAYGRVIDFETDEYYYDQIEGYIEIIEPPATPPPLMPFLFLGFFGLVVVSVIAVRRR